MKSELQSFGLSLKHITVHVMTAEQLVTSRFGLRASRHLWLLGQMSCQSNVQRKPQMASAFGNLVQQRLLFLHLPGHTWRLHFPASFAATLTIPLGSGHKAPTLTFDTFFFSSLVTNPEVMYWWPDDRTPELPHRVSPGEPSATSECA